MMWQRAPRVAKLLQQEISKIVLEFKDPRIGFVTITGVRLTNDLKDARVYFSVYGTETHPEETKELLSAAIPDIRDYIRRQLTLKYIPNLEFCYDDTPEKASRIFTIFQKLERERNSSDSSNSEKGEK